MLDAPDKEAAQSPSFNVHIFELGLSSTSLSIGKSNINPSWEIFERTVTQVALVA